MDALTGLFQQVLEVSQAKPPGALAREHCRVLLAGGYEDGTRRHFLYQISDTVVYDLFGARFTPSPDGAKAVSFYQSQYFLWDLTGDAPALTLCQPSGGGIRGGPGPGYYPIPGEAQAVRFTWRADQAELGAFLARHITLLTAA